MADNNSYKNVQTIKRTKKKKTANVFMRRHVRYNFYNVTSDFSLNLY